MFEDYGNRYWRGGKIWEVVSTKSACQLSEVRGRGKLQVVSQQFIHQMGLGGVGDQINKGCAEF